PGHGSGGEHVRPDRRRPGALDGGARPRHTRATGAVALPRQGSGRARVGRQRPMGQVQAFVEAWVIPLQLVLAMGGMGATLTPDDFTRIGREPRSLWLGLAMQWLLVPAVAALVIAITGMSPGWAV